MSSWHCSNFHAWFIGTWSGKFSSLVHLRGCRHTASTRRGTHHARRSRYYLRPNQTTVRATPLTNMPNFSHSTQLLGSA